MLAVMYISIVILCIEVAMIIMIFTKDILKNNQEVLVYEGGFPRNPSSRQGVQYIYASN